MFRKYITIQVNYNVSITCKCYLLLTYQSGVQMNKIYLGSYLMSVFCVRIFRKNTQFSYVQRGKAEGMSKDITQKRADSRLPVM